MSVSCVGTCSNCGERRFWLSGTLSLQLDDGRMKCLRHPGEDYDCEREGLTLAQASARGRLYRETFYVCRNCGKEGVTIERHFERDLFSFSVRGAMIWGWGSALVVVPVLAWMRWWDAIAPIAATLVAAPAIAWWENRKAANAFAARGLPTADAPGRVGIGDPLAGCSEQAVVGRVVTTGGNPTQATGPCCASPDWLEAAFVKDDDRVPCSSCGAGVMVVSEHAIH